MILIADSGATKTHWVLLDKGKKCGEIYTPGFNPYYYPTEDFERSLRTDLVKLVSGQKLTNVYFYGSGISSDVNRKIVSDAIHHIFPEIIVETFHDLHGAAIALLGNSKGIACILGTGSNSCLFDGQKVVQNVPSVGYLLGDEGSGTYIGKLFVKDVLVGAVDREIADLFYSKNKLSFSGTLDRIYKEQNPNLFFSQQTKLIRDHKNTPYFNDLISRAFHDFVEVQLSRYPGYSELPVGFVGSIAANFEDVLQKVLSNHNIKLGKIMKEPMKGMIEHHINQLDARL